jgi:hypothetical protein
MKIYSQVQRLFTDMHALKKGIVRYLNISKMFMKNIHIYPNFTLFLFAVIIKHFEVLQFAPKRQQNSQNRSVDDQMWE